MALASAYTPVSLPPSGTLPPAYGYQSDSGELLPGYGSIIRGVVLDSDENQFTVSPSVLNSSGTAYAVGQYVLNSSGDSFRALNPQYVGLVLNSSSIVFDVPVGVLNSAGFSFSVNSNVLDSNGYGFTLIS